MRTAHAACLNEHPCPLSDDSNAVLWAAPVLGEPKGAPAATVAPLVLGLAEAFTHAVGRAPDTT